MAVLIHGFAGLPSFWDRVVAHAPALAGAHRICLPGHGNVPAATSWDNAIARVASEIPTGCTTAIGYSLGARVALGLLASGVVQRVIAISGHPGISDHDRADRMRADAAWAARFETEPLTQVLAAWQQQPVLRSYGDGSDLEQARRLRLRIQGHRGPALAHAMRTLGLAQMPQYQRVIGQHVDDIQWLVGEHDGKFSGLANTLREALPRLHVTSLAGSGHDPTLDVPSQLATQLTRLLR